MEHSFPATFGRLVIDPETNLPLVPQGFEWHVKRPRYHDPEGELKVELQLHYTYFRTEQENYGFLGLRVRSVQKPYTRVYNDCKEVCLPFPHTIKRAAEILYNKADNRLRQQHNVSAVLGVYPPKSL